MDQNYFYDRVYKTVGGYWVAMGIGDFFLGRHETRAQAEAAVNAHVAARKILTKANLTEADRPIGGAKDATAK